MATAKKVRPMSSKVRLYMAKHPKATTKEICEATGAAQSYVYVIKADMKKRMAATKATIAEILHVTGTGNEYEQKGDKWVAVQEGAARLKAADEFAQAQHDSVNHPAHYKVGGIETIDFIEAKQLSYHLGNVVKYITRADHKGNRIEDLQKARWYLNREIARLEGAK